MAAPTAPTEQADRPLNPEMTRATTTNVPRRRLPISIVSSVLRPLVAILSFIDFIFWARASATFGHKFMTLIFVELLFLIIWTVSATVFRGRISVLKHLFPADGMSCQLGPLKCICLGQDDDDDEHGPPKKKRKLPTLSWVVDLYFAVTLLVFSTVDLSSWYWDRIRWYHLEAPILLYIIIGLQFLITFFTFLGIWLKNKPFPIVLYADQIESVDSHQYRIRLPQEQDVRALRQQPISVAA